MAIGALISLIPTIASLFASNKGHNQYGKDLEAIRKAQQPSQAMLQARSLYAENATRGLPGYETYKQDIENTIPETLNQSKDWLTGNGAIELLGSARARADQQIRQLNAANDQARMGNMDAYGRFLSGPMAADEINLRNTVNELAVGQAYNKADKGAAGSNIMGQFSNTLSKLSDEDLSKLIALLSKNDYGMDLTTGIDYGMGSGQFSTANDAPVDRMASIPSSSALFNV